MSSERFLDDDRLTRSFLTTGYFMFALLLVTAAVALVDARLLNGVNIWWKPLKFDFSIMLHAFTLAVLAQQLERRFRNGAVMGIVGFLFVLAAVFETIYISVQAMRGRHSHFNFETVPEQILYALMGVGAILLIAAPFVMGVRLIFQRTDEKSGYRLGSILGMTIGPVLTFFLAGYMSMSGSHYVDAPDASDAGGIFLLGWSMQEADLRPAHFFALHLIQIAPAAGFVFDRIAKPLARLLVWAVALGTSALSVGLFVRALSGQPVWPF